jgi:hypothetical protein
MACSSAACALGTFFRFRAAALTPSYTVGSFFRWLLLPLFKRSEYYSEISLPYASLLHRILYNSHLLSILCLDPSQGNQEPQVSSISFLSQFWTAEGLAKLSDILFPAYDDPGIILILVTSRERGQLGVLYPLPFPM